MMGRYPITRQYVFVGACLQKITWWSARHNELRDLQAKLLDMVCYDVQVELALQPITGEELARGTNH